MSSGRDYRPRDQRERGYYPPPPDPYYDYPYDPRMRPPYDDRYYYPPPPPPPYYDYYGYHNRPYDDPQTTDRNSRLQPHPQPQYQPQPMDQPQYQSESVDQSVSVDQPVNQLVDQLMGQSADRRDMYDPQPDRMGVQGLPVLPDDYRGDVQGGMPHRDDISDMYSGRDDMFYPPEPANIEIPTPDVGMEQRRRTEYDFTELENFESAAPASIDWKKLHHDTKLVHSIEEIEEFMMRYMIKIIGGDNTPPAFTFEELNLPQEIMAIINRNGWAKPRPIQAASLPLALHGIDTVGIATTGSGKTASFVIPAVIHLIDQADKTSTRVLCLSPTRELVTQIANDFRVFAQPFGFNVLDVIGGEKKLDQLNRYRSAVPQIIVATPGRLLDFVKSGAMSLSNVTYFIIDEADELFKTGFSSQIRKIFSLLQPNRQVTMWSATWPEDLVSVAEDLLNDPAKVIIGRRDITVNPNIKQEFIMVSRYNKRDKLLAILNDNKDKKILVFVNRKADLDELAGYIQSNGIRAMSIHGDKDQWMRNGIMNEFRTSNGGVLLSSDVLGRGIDIPSIDIVVNFDFPDSITKYTHRIGRTARGDNKGLAITFMSPRDERFYGQLREILQAVDQEIPDFLN